MYFPHFPFYIHKRREHIYFGHFPHLSYCASYCQDLAKPCLQNLAPFSLLLLLNPFHFTSSLRLHFHHTHLLLSLKFNPFSGKNLGFFLFLPNFVSFLLLLWWKAHLSSMWVSLSLSSLFLLFPCSWLSYCMWVFFVFVFSCWLLHCLVIYTVNYVVCFVVLIWSMILRWIYFVLIVFDWGLIGWSSIGFVCFCLFFEEDERCEIGLTS